MTNNGRWLPAALLLAAGCTTEGTRADSRSGCRIDVRRVAELGSETDPVSILYDTGFEVRGLAGGEWLVLIPGRAPAILRYRADGRFDRVIGREGGGPGEYRDVSAAAIGPGDSIWVSDILGGKIQVYDPHGDLAREIAPTHLRLRTFSPSGHAATLGFRGAEGRGGIWARIWTTSLDSVGAIGPGADPFVASHASPTTAGIRSQAAVLTSDTTAWSIDLGRGWLMAWNRHHLTRVLQRFDVWRALDPDRELAPADSGMVLALQGDPEGRVWGVVTPRPRSVQDSLPLPYEGILWVADTSGHLLATTLTAETPAGFADAMHFYTVFDKPSGFLAIRIWNYTLQCD